MKYFAKLVKNQQGMSLIYTILIVSLSLGGLAYVTTEMLPKLHGEKKKAEATIDYRVFISSLNDYLIHGIRERWCISVNSDGVTDLLLSNDCGSDKTMEHIVTYPGNLERILWGPENIGTPLTAPPSPETANRILALNYSRYYGDPQKATKLLGYDDVYPAGGKLKFKVTQAVLQDMTDQHPLYLISKSVRDCIDQVNIEIFQIKDFNMINAGDERKIGINITTDISRTRFSCTVMRQAESTTYYTFYPRRLHTFSLMKYGNLDGSAYNEFHGPVYVAGDFVLPPEGFDKELGSVFYAPLVLGMYNQGGEGGTFRAGRIVNANNTDYTFEDRGHPYLSKQDNYPNFRGFLGGINLDASEDKGFPNLYDHTASSSADKATLEACIEETKVQTTPTMNDRSRLGYRYFSEDSNSRRLTLAFNRKNRFRLSSAAPGIISGNSRKDETALKAEPLRIDVISNGARTLGTLTLKLGGRDFVTEMGSGATSTLYLNLEHFKLTKTELDQQLNKLDEAKSNNYRNVIDNNHVLRELNESRQYLEAADEFREKCERRVASECLGFGYDTVTCTTCDYDDERDEYNDKKNALKNKLESIRGSLEAIRGEEDKPGITFSMSDVPKKEGKTVLNKKNFEITYNEAWKTFFPLIRKEFNDDRDEDEIFGTFVADHYASGGVIRRLRFNMSGNQATDFDLLITKFSGLFGMRQEIVEKNPSLRNETWKDTEYETNEDEIDPEPTDIIDLNCPTGMGIADWDLDMSGSTNFAWNYANTPPGAQVDTPNHDPADPITFDNSMLEGHAASYTKSIVSHCIIPKERTHVYGFYVCDKLTIQGGRSSPLYMIGTFIVNQLIQPTGTNIPIHWHSIWDTKATDLVMSDLNSSKSACSNTSLLMNYTWKDLKENGQVLARLNSCSPMDMVSNGPNNFSWTTVDPDIGIANPGDVMTSQKVNRIQKWAIREDSRTDMIR